MDFRDSLRKGELKQEGGGAKFYELKKGALLLGFCGYDIGVRGIRIKELRVARCFRGQGIGSDLLGYIEGRGVNRGLLFVEVLVHEEGALSWFKKQGYSGSLVVGAFGDRDGVLFRKMI